MASAPSPSSLTVASPHLQDLNLSFKPPLFFAVTKTFSIHPVVLRCSGDSNNGRLSKSLVVAALASEAEVAEQERDDDAGGAVAVAVKPKKGKAALPLKRDRQLIGDNYPSWSRSMLIALSIRNKLGFVDGSILQPKPDSPQLAAWNRCNNIVISWILNSVSKEISTSILYSTLAVEIWEDLHERFQVQNVPRIFQVRRDLMSLCQTQSSVASYFTQLKSLWDELVGLVTVLAPPIFQPTFSISMSCFS